MSPPSRARFAGIDHAGRCHRPNRTPSVRALQRAKVFWSAMIIYFDESGYTGRDLLNRAQPIFVGASTNLNYDAAAALVSTCFPDVRARELKHSVLCRRPRGQEQVIRLLKNICPDDFAVSVAHKEFVVVALLVDYWVEPAMRDDGINLYERGGNLALCNALYQVLRLCLPAVDRREFFLCAQKMLRTRSPEAYKAFGRSLRAAQQRAEPLREMLAVLVAADLGLGGYEHVRSLPERLTDVGTVYLMDQICHWSGRTAQALKIVHDRSSALGREKHVWEAIMAPDVPPAVVGQDRRTIQFPLRVDSIELANSEDHLQLQLADLVAGAFATYVSSLTGDEPVRRAGYVQELKACGLMRRVRIANAIWPGTEVTPEELDTEGDVQDDAATHIARILRDKGVKQPGLARRDD